MDCPSQIAPARLHLTVGWRLEEIDGISAFVESTPTKEGWKQSIIFKQPEAPDLQVQVEVFPAFPQGGCPRSSVDVIIVRTDEGMKALFFDGRPFCATFTVMEWLNIQPQRSSSKSA